jgi:hypothetical protein
MAYICPSRHRVTFQSHKALINHHIGGGQLLGFDVAKDGRFLIPTVAGQPGVPIMVVVNQTAALNR